jgi:predicted TIM-barrel fold metal-dependent hydrolase
MKAFLRGESEQGGSPSLNAINALAVPEFVDRRARVATMDAQNVEACLILPTTGVGVEPQLRETPHVLYPSLRAFNRWLEEDWGFGADGRVYGAPLLSLFDRDEALVELGRLLQRGARFAVLTAGPIAGRSPADPYFDPFWARCEEAGLNVVYHIGRTPFSEMYNPPWGLRPHPPSHRHSLMEWALSFTERPIVDTLTALIADNLFGRFPRLRILSVEYGSTWVAPLTHKLDHLARLYSKDMWRFGAPPLKPSDTVRQNVWVAPFFEDDIVALARLIGPTHVLSGSDYPHPEGLLWPREFADELDGMSDAEVRLIMRDNLAGLIAR